ncbi:MAG: hypothetical protein K8R02_09260 [Anaerohalosphaeraceae bacterium]|nr:hypothetical protein [Anaerohalosphaeraceae bacterium]
MKRWMINLIVVIGVVLLASIANASVYYENFDDTNGLSISAADPNAVMVVDSNDKIEGSASIKLTFTVSAGAASYEIAYISKKLGTPVDMTDVGMVFSVCPVTRDTINSVYIYLYDTSGNYEYWRWWSSMTEDEWTQFSLQQGQAGTADNHSIDPDFNPKYVSKLQFRLRSHESRPGQEVSLRWDGYKASPEALTRPIQLFVDDTLEGIAETAEVIGKVSSLGSPPVSSDIVNTNFELDSAGTGTWDTSVSNIWDEPDIISNLNWVPTAGSTTIATSGAYVGSQCGRVQGSSGEGSTALDFGSGFNTDKYVATWYGKYVWGGNGYRTHYTYFTDDFDRLATTVRMECLSGGAIKRIVCRSNFSDVILLSDFSLDTWYKFELTTDFSAKTFDLRVKQAGAGAWEAEDINRPFENSDADSFDRIKCRFWKDGDSGYWDDIKIAVDCNQQTVIYAGKYDDPCIAPLVADANLTVDVNWVGEQGFYVKSFDDSKILVTGKTLTGVLYGLIELRDRIDIEGIVVLEQDFDIASRPTFETRTSDTYKRANFASYYMNEYADSTPIYHYDANLFDDEAQREAYTVRVEASRNGMRSSIATAKAYGAKVYVFSYLPSMPEWMIDNFIAVHPETEPYRRTEYYHPFICPSKQASKDLLYNKIRNLFEDVNDIGGILLNIGEHCQSIYSCGCGDCGNEYDTTLYRNRLIEYVNLIRKAMLEARGYDPNYSYPDDFDAPKVYLRPWGIINHGLGGNPNLFESLSGDLPTDVRFRAKLTVPPANDYAWKNDFTQYVDMPRMETFGWHNYHPSLNQPCPAQLCYTGPKFCSRAMAMANEGVSGQANTRGPDASDVLYEPSRLAGNRIAWDPCSFDSNDFLLSWATSRFGTAAAPNVVSALDDSYKITDAVITYPEMSGWFNIMTFVKDNYVLFYDRACVGSQTSSVKNVSTGTLSSVLSQFSITEANNIAVQAEQNFANAVSINPDSNDLQRWWDMSKATKALTGFYRNYHYALVYNNLYGNTGNSSYRNTAASYIELALPQAEDYVDLMNQLHPKFNDYFREFEAEWSKDGIPGGDAVGGSYFFYGQMAALDQQCKTGYSRLVMQPMQESNYPYLHWQATNNYAHIGNKRHSPFDEEDLWPYTYNDLKSKWEGSEYVVDTKVGNFALPQIISPWILPTLKVQFRDDLSNGAMLKITFVPLGCKARYSLDGGLVLRKSLQKILLNGQHIETLVDITVDDALMDDEFVRYVELPLTGSGVQDYELTFQSKPNADAECIGTEFYDIKLYTPDVQSAMVNTTFEAGSAGTGTWTLSEWGDETAGSGNNDPDPITNVKWLNNSGSQQVVGSGDAYSGSQCGRVTGSSSTSAKYAKLDFAGGGNTGIYKVTWYQKTKIISGSSERRYSYFTLYDETTAKWAARIQVNPGKGDVEIYDGSGYTKIMDAADNTWYEFEMILNYQTHKFDIKARQAGSTGPWNIAAEQDFYDATCNSLDRVYGYGRCNEIYGYFDDIKVEPVCGGLGYPDGDLNEDCSVDMNDVAVFVSHWLDTSCASPGWCEGSDLDKSTDVEFVDLAILAENWLEDRQN